MIVYELHTGRGMGSRTSVSATVERAKRDAEERLKGYWESAKDASEDWGLVESLTWEVKPYTFAKGGAFTEPKPRWTAVMDDAGNAFTIKEIEVLEW